MNKLSFTDILLTRKNGNTIRKWLTLILLPVILLSCKNKMDKEFEVIIKTEAKIDSLSMYPSFVSEKFLDSTYSMLFKGPVEGGIVNFKGKKPPHPVMFDILADKIGLSDKFFIDGGLTQLSVSFVNKDKKVIITDKKSKTHKEYELLKSKGLDSIDNLWWQASSVDERIKVGELRDRFIVDFLKDNPNSYVPLWLFANYFSSRSQRYNKLYDESMNLFSDEIKKTELFDKLHTGLKKSQSFSLKNKELPLKNIDLRDASFKLNDFSNNKYILLDFWFSNCKPCLVEMPKYIHLYEKYKEQGFEIVSISIDKTDKIQNWKNTINEKGFNWVHYLDENGIETNKLNIISFPTTFLINSEGAIIERNITPEDLNNFLQNTFD